MVVHMPNGMMNVNPNTNGRANVNPSDSAGERKGISGAIGNPNLRYSKKKCIYS